MKELLAISLVRSSDRMVLSDILDDKIRRHEDVRKKLLDVAFIFFYFDNNEGIMYTVFC